MSDELLEVIPEPADSVSSTQTITTPTKLDGVVIGMLVDLRDAGTPIVAFPGNPESTGISAPARRPLYPTTISVAK